MFTDPQTITVNAEAKSLPRTESEGTRSSYSKDDGTLTLSVSHLETKNSRIRRQVRLDFNKIADDPYVAGNSRMQSGSIYFVVDEPDAGQFTNAELLLNAKALIAWMTDANVTKVLAGEH